MIRIFLSLDEEEENTGRNSPFVSKSGRKGNSVKQPPDPQLGNGRSKSSNGEINGVVKEEKIVNGEVKSEPTSRGSSPISHTVRLFKFSSFNHLFVCFHFFVCFCFLLFQFLPLNSLFRYTVSFFIHCYCYYYEKMDVEFLSFSQRRPRE